MRLSNLAHAPLGYIMKLQITANKKALAHIRCSCRVAKLSESYLSERIDKTSVLEAAIACNTNRPPACIPPARPPTVRPRADHRHPPARQPVSTPARWAARTSAGQPTKPAIPLVIRFNIEDDELAKPLCRPPNSLSRHRNTVHFMVSWVQTLGVLEPWTHALNQHWRIDCKAMAA